MTSEAYRRNFLEIDWGPDKEVRPVEVKPKGPQGGPWFLPDIKPFVSPIDFSVVSSRSVLREHEKRHGVRQVGDLKLPKDFDNSSRRAENAFREKAFDDAFRRAVEKTGL